ncbi:hypothetical protein ABEB36_013083 [Hypothenemus hampei]|uniref:Cytochrome P450 n=1 Tax=Hypothenemus hampei TaxID=57062 RepID=A0ABD1E6S0_HYPHA
MFLFYIFIAILIAYLTYLYWKNANFRRKLLWIPDEPGSPFVGMALQLADTIKLLPLLQRLLLKHNDIFYTHVFTEPHIIVSDYKFLEWLLTSTTVIQKTQGYDYLDNWLNGGILISAGIKWKKSRKILTPAFHFAILEQFSDTFDECSTVLIDVLSKEVDKTEVDVCPIAMNFTLDVICQTSLGVRLDIQKNSQKEYLQAVAFMGSLIMERIFNFLLKNDFLYQFSPTGRKEKKYVKLMHEMSDKIIAKRKREMKESLEQVDQNDGTKRKLAFLDLLLQYRDENGQPLSDEFIRSEVDTIMFAGHDTTGICLGFALYCLANHSKEQAEALNEVKEVLGDRTKITHKDLKEMKYLELVIKETLRLYPSVPIYGRRVSEDVVYENGKILPKGLVILIIAYAVNRNPKVYDRPDEFIPTRFIGNDPKLFSYLPFSAGPRNCIGQKFAILELKSVLAKILLNFELLPAEPKFTPIVSSQTVLKTQNGIKIRLRKRLK